MSKPWADSPFQLQTTPAFTQDVSDPYVHLATDMALIHNCILRGLNAVYNQSLAVSSLPPHDISGFITFCQCWSEFIHAHHDGEEEFLFPRLESLFGETGIMDANVEQHKLFHPGLKQFDDYVYNVTPDSYDGEEIRRRIGTFGEILKTHLDEELVTLLELKRFGTDKAREILKLADDHGAHVMQNVSKTRAFLGATSCLDVEFEGGIHTNFPPAPTPVKWLYRYVFWQTGRNVWKFAPCWNTTGTRRELYALQQ